MTLILTKGNLFLKEKILRVVGECSNTKGRRYVLRSNCGQRKPCENQIDIEKKIF